MRTPNVLHAICAAAAFAGCGDPSTKTDSPPDLAMGMSPDLATGMSPDLATVLPSPDLADPGPFRVTSSTIIDGGRLPDRYAYLFCDGNNVSPPLTVAGIPMAARSLAIRFEDLSNPNAKYWLAWNIPLDAQFEEDASRSARYPQAITWTGKHGYVGPCTPYVSHYRIHVYALREAAFDLGDDPFTETFVAAMAASTVAEAQLNFDY